MLNNTGLKLSIAAFFRKCLTRMSQAKNGDALGLVDGVVDGVEVRLLQIAERIPNPRRFPRKPRSCLDCDATLTNSCNM